MAVEAVYFTTILPGGLWETTVAVAKAPAELQQTLLARGYEWNAPDGWLLRTFPAADTQPENDYAQSKLDVELEWISNTCRPVRKPTRWSESR